MDRRNLRLTKATDTERRERSDAMDRSMIAIGIPLSEIAEGLSLTAFDLNEQYCVFGI